MPLPLKPSENVYVEHLVKFNYSMPTMQAATDHYNIGFIISGDRKWISNEYIRTGHAGDVGISKPYVYHRSCSMSDTPYDRYMLKIRDTSFEPIIDIIGKRELDKLCSNYLHFTKDSQLKITEMFEEMLQEYKKNTPASQLVLQGMVHKLFFYIYDNHISSEYDKYAYHLNFFDERIQDALIFVENNLKYTPTLNETAKHVSLSPSHFSRLFKEVTGSSYSDYVSEVRLEHAQILLESTKKNIQEIANEVGVSSGNYLCNIFKQKYSISPSEFRKRACINSQV